MKKIEMFSKYVDAAMHHAGYSILEDGTFLGKCRNLTASGQMHQHSKRAGMN